MCWWWKVIASTVEHSNYISFRLMRYCLYICQSNYPCFIVPSFIFHLLSSRSHFLPLLFSILVLYSFQIYISNRRTSFRVFNRMNLSSTITHQTSSIHDKKKYISPIFFSLLAKGYIDKWFSTLVARMYEEKILSFFNWMSFFSTFRSHTHIIPYHIDIGFLSHLHSQTHVSYVAVTMSID